MKYEVRTYDTNSVVYGPASMTSCKDMARNMNINGRKSVYAAPVKK